MFKLIRGLFSGGPYYLRINRERVAVRDIRTNKTFECRTILGIDGEQRVVSVGVPVSSETAKEMKPFDHPRVLVDDYMAARVIITYALQKICGMRFLRPSPIVLVHPDLVLKGGLAPIEARALREMVEFSGARKVLLYHGTMQPSDQELREILAFS